MRICSEEREKKHSEIFLKKRIVFGSNVWGKKESLAPRATSLPLSRFLFLAFTDLHLIEADNGQERHGEK